MITKAVRDDAMVVINTIIEALLSGMALSGTTGSSMRFIVGDLRANAIDYFTAGTIGTKLQECFDQAIVSGATLAQMDVVREALMPLQPTYHLGVVLKTSGIVFSFSGQCNIISVMTFNSRIDVDAMLNKMNPIIEDIKLEVSELLFGNSYSSVVALSAALIQHLVATERVLPRVVSYTMPLHLPSLNIANYLYGDGSRSDQLIRENKTVHPAFMQRDIIALSA